MRRPFPSAGTDMVDPFLLLDEMGPVDWPPGGAIGAPDHPHRGFETVTYMLEGTMRHRDSRGHEGAIGPGDVQWMTAGDGVVHSEMPDERLLREGGPMHGFQLWVNLPRRDKRMAPRYQEVPAGRIPEVTSDDGRVRVRIIAGQALGASAVIDTRTPIAFLHFTIEAGGQVTQPVPREQHGFAYVFGGTARLSGQRVDEGQMAVLAADGDAVTLAVDDDARGPADVLLVTGTPLAEPVARYGPFVMNAKHEILEAIDDFQRGRMGRIHP